MTTDPELVPVAQDGLAQCLRIIATDHDPQSITRLTLEKAAATIADHARTVAELEAESHRRLQIANDAAAIATEFQRRYKEAKAELAALRARVEAAPVGKLVGMEHSASNLVYRVALHGPKQNGPELLTVVRLLAAPAGGEG